MSENAIYTNRFTISVNDHDVHIYFQTQSPKLDMEGKITGEEYSDRTHFVMTRGGFDTFLTLGSKIVEDQKKMAAEKAASKPAE